MPTLVLQIVPRQENAPNAWLKSGWYSGFARNWNDTNPTTNTTTAKPLSAYLIIVRAFPKSALIE
jgi:hypothetical protein